MNIYQLRLFLDLSDTLNYNTTAKRHYTTCQSVARAMRMLETELGATLFERSSKRIDLTEKGRIFRGKVRMFIESCDAISLELAQMARGLENALHFSLDATVAPQIVRLFTSYNASVEEERQRLRISQDDSRQCIKKVLNGVSDACFVQIEQRDIDESLEMVTMTVDRMAFLVSRSNALFDREIITLADLDGQVIAVPTDYEYRFRSFCQEVKSNAIHLRSDVRINLGEAFYPDSCSLAFATSQVGKELADKDLRIIEFEGDAHKVYGCLCYRKDSARLPVIMDLRAYLESRM